MREITRSLSADEVSDYCREQNTGVEIDGSAFFYRDCDPQGFSIKAPVEIRQMLMLVLCLVESLLAGEHDSGIIWLGRFDVGVLDSAKLGQKVLSDLRSVVHDLRSLRDAPAQWFGAADGLELSIFLIQVLLYGWPGHSLFSHGRYLINFTSSGKWVFRARTVGELDILRTTLQPWKPQDVADQG
jgi:hypothetical protein